MFELDIMSANYILHWRMRRQKCVIMQEWVCISVAIFMFKLDYEYLGCGSLIRKKMCDNAEVCTAVAITKEAN